MGANLPVNVNEAAELFTNVLLNVANYHAPIRKLKIWSNQPKWITSDFLYLLDEKQHICNVHRRRPTQFTAARKREIMQRVARTKRLRGRTYIMDSLE